MSKRHRRTGKARAALATFPWKVLWGEVTGRHPHRAARGVTPRLSTSTGHQWSRIPPQVEAKLSHPVAQGLAAAASLTTPAGHSHVRGKGGRKRGRPLSCSSSSNSSTHSLTHSALGFGLGHWGLRRAVGWRRSRGCTSWPGAWPLSDPPPPREQVQVARGLATRPAPFCRET